MSRPMCASELCAITRFRIITRHALIVHNSERANQLRLYFASFAYVLLHGLRRLGLEGTPHAKAQCTTIRVKLLKIAARIRVTVRKVWLSFSETCPYISDVAQILANLRRYPAWAPPE